MKYKYLKTITDSLKNNNKYLKRFFQLPSIFFKHRR